MKKPLVSIIIPTYNRVEYIKRAIGSVLNQTYKNVEIIIVDESDNDRIRTTVQPYLSNPFIRYFYQKRIYLNNLRARYINILLARNKGIENSQGKYIAFLDDDDVWIDNQKLAKQVDFLEKHPDYVLVGGGLIRIDEKGKEIFKNLLPETDKEIREMMLFVSPFLISCVIFRKDAWIKMGRDNIKTSIADWEILYKLGRQGKMYNFQEFFVQNLSLPKEKNARNEKEKNARNEIKLQLQLIPKYRKDYPHFYKAFLLIYVRYLYAFLPISFRKFLSPVISWARKILFNVSLYYDRDHTLR